MKPHPKIIDRQTELSRNGKRPENITKLTHLAISLGWVPEKPKFKFAVKTARRRGVILAFIRDQAKRIKSFHAANLCPPLSLTQADRNLRYLEKKGELTVKCHRRIYQDGKPTPIYYKPRRFYDGAMPRAVNNPKV